MTAAADREAFERWYNGPQPNWPTLSWERYLECYLAGLAHARQEAEERVAALERELKDATYDAAEAHDEAVRWSKRLSAAESALPSGYRVDAEHDLAARVRELAAFYGRHADALRKIGALEAENGYIKDRVRKLLSTPAPLTAAERAVVDAAMAEHALRVAGRPDYDYRAAGALHEACAALAAEREPKPVDPWATLEGVLHRLEQDVEVNELSADRSDWYRLWMRDYDRIREMLKRALSQREGGGA